MTFDYLQTIIRFCEDSYYEMSNPELAQEYMGRLGSDYVLLHSISSAIPSVVNQIICKRKYAKQAIENIERRCKHIAENILAEQKALDFVVADLSRQKARWNE